MLGNARQISRLRKVRPLSMKSSRTAVLLDQHPLWLDAVEQVLATIQIDVLARSTAVGEVVALVDAYEPDVLLAGLDDARSNSSAALDVLREAHARVPALKLVV